MRVFPLIVFLALAAVPAFAEESAPSDAPAATVGIRPLGGNLGLGATLGWPTGFTGKWWYTGDQGVGFGVGIGGFSWIGGYANWQWSPMMLYQSPEFAAAPYFGIGGFAGLFPTIYSPFLRTNAVVFALGLEVPLGIAVNPSNYPLDVFFELTPGLSVLPHIGVGGRAVLGFRWYM